MQEGQERAREAAEGAIDADAGQDTGEAANGPQPDIDQSFNSESRPGKGRGPITGQLPLPRHLHLCWSAQRSCPDGF